MESKERREKKSQQKMNNKHTGWWLRYTSEVCLMFDVWWWSFKICVHVADCKKFHLNTTQSEATQNPPMLQIKIKITNLNNNKEIQAHTHHSYTVHRTPHTAPLTHKHSQYHNHETQNKYRTIFEMRSSISTKLFHRFISFE